MDNVNYHPPMLREIVRSGALEDDPLVVFDVGCGLGVDEIWRLFEPHLVVHGFDPQTDEIERLRAAERNPRVHYHAGFVGLPDGHPFVEQRRSEERCEAYFNPWARLSTAQALARAAESGPSDLEETNDWIRRPLASETFTLAEFARSNHIGSIDFVKTDTDGHDLEVLQSFVDMVEPARVLGFMIETSFLGSDAETSHSFHNVDRLMRRHGFQLWTLSVNRYSRAALPAPFTHSILAQTTWGQAIWGDVVYLRDGVNPEGDRFGTLSATKLLKLACLCELYETPDAAAEILVSRRDLLAPLVPVDDLLELLTPPLGGRQVSYREYLAAFRADPTSFYPGSPTRPSSVPVRSRPGLAGRALRRLRRFVR